MTETQKWIVGYLDGKGWTSPTDIGGAYGDFKKPHGIHNYHSAWASPRCKSLVSHGILERNENGHYRLRSK